MNVRMLKMHVILQLFLAPIPTGSWTLNFKKEPQVHNVQATLLTLKTRGRKAMQNKCTTWVLVITPYNNS